MGVLFLYFFREFGLIGGQMAWESVFLSDGPSFVINLLGLIFLMCKMKVLV